jgi:hypothetical protein
VAVSCAVPATTGIASSYDVDSGVELRRSDKYITVTVNISPPDFHFYRVDADGKAVFTTESPYHGDFAITNTFAFRGRPATHLVTHEGRFLKLDGCLTATSSYPPSGACLVKDGVLGTLQTSQSFFAMETGGDGYLYAIAGTYGGCRRSTSSSASSGARLPFRRRGSRRDSVSATTASRAARSSAARRRAARRIRTRAAAGGSGRRRTDRDPRDRYFQRPRP